MLTYKQKQDFLRVIQQNATMMPTGPQGTPGTPGAKGDKGDQGIPGQNGTNGTNGTNGAPGQDGQQGAQGNPGIAGLNGSNGRDGAQPNDLLALINYAFARIVFLEQAMGITYSPEFIPDEQVSLLTEAQHGHPN